MDEHFPYMMTHERISMLGNRKGQQWHAQHKLQDHAADPLTFPTMGHLHAHLRYRLGADGVEGWGRRTVANRFHLTTGIIDSVENTSSLREARFTHPLNLRFAVALPAIGDAMFAPPNATSKRIATKVQKHFWERAWDYVHAAELAWERSAIKRQLNVDPELLQQSIHNTKIAITERLSVLGLDPQSLVWEPETSPYQAFMGNAAHRRGHNRAVVNDPGVRPCASSREADTFGGLVWAIVAPQKASESLKRHIDLPRHALDEFFGRLTGKGHPDGRPVIERPGYQPQILRKLELMLDHLKSIDPSFDAFDEGRYWCLAEDYAYAALDYTYQPNRGRQVQALRVTANQTLEYTIPEKMAEFVSREPIQAIKAAMACDNSLLYSIALSEIKMLRQRNQLSEDCLRRDVPQALQNLHVMPVTSAHRTAR